MEIKRQYLQRHLHDIAIDQLTADYTAKGYQVSKEERIGMYRADLVARKGSEVVVIEIKTGKMTAEKRQEVAEVGDYVRNHEGYKFLMVLATPPKPKKIDIPNLEHLLFEYLVDNFPNALTNLSSSTRITDVPDITVDEVVVAEDGSIVAKGNGTVEVELQYNASTNDGAVTGDAFPFNFEITLTYNQNKELVLADARRVDVDVSSFHE